VQSPLILRPWPQSGYRGTGNVQQRATALQRIDAMIATYNAQLQQIQMIQSQASNAAQQAQFNAQMAQTQQQLAMMQQPRMLAQQQAQGMGAQRVGFSWTAALAARRGANQNRAGVGPLPFARDERTTRVQALIGLYMAAKRQNHEEGWLQETRR